MRSAEYLFANAVPNACLQSNISASDAQTIFNLLRPKLDEAKGNLSSTGSTFDSLLSCIYDEMGHIKNKKVDSIPKWMLPRRSSSKKTWTSIFSKIQDSEELNLNTTELQVVRKINYMMYVECAYSVVVDRLYYALAYTNSLPNLSHRDIYPSFSHVVYYTKLTKKVRFIKNKLSLPLKNIPDITEACNIYLRNMVAHGRLVGELAGMKPNFSEDMIRMVDPVCVSPFRADLESAEMVDLNAEYKKIQAITDAWNIALNIYRDIEFGTWRLTPKLWQSPPEFDLRSV